MARILVGLAGLVGDIRKYKDKYDIVELRPIDTSVPRATTLRSWRKSVAPGFVFGVVLPRSVGALSAAGAAEDLDHALEVARAVEARCLVLATPPEVRPTATNRKRIAALLEKLPRTGTVVAWEPRGMWEHDDIIATARGLGVVPVLDAAREDLAPGPIAYTRLRALGSAGVVSAATVQRVADRLRGRREAFVIVEGKGDVGRVRSGLQTALARKASGGAGGFVVRPAPASLVAEDEEQ